MILCQFDNTHGEAAMPLIYHDESEYLDVPSVIHIQFWLCKSCIDSVYSDGDTGSYDPLTGEIIRKVYEQIQEAEARVVDFVPIDVLDVYKGEDE